MKKEKSTIDIKEIPKHARRLTSIGDKTTEVVWRFYKQRSGLFAYYDNTKLDELADALIEQEWADEDAAKLIEAFSTELDKNRKIDPKDLARWTLLHDSPASIIDCMKVEPPDEYRIIKVLSRAGSQKLVFLARSAITQREVVLKQFINVSDHIIKREMGAHPLNINHRHIVKTYFRKNVKGETFLIENRLPDVLDDNWESKGIQEAANLLNHIAGALRYLHELGLVHGDVKPDNIGKQADDYILLDFGICRPTDEFTPESTPTGSIRTRAPELLLNKKITDPQKIDIWALAATVYKGVTGRFPLIKNDEEIPRVSSPKERLKFEQLLSKRASEEWDKWVDLSKVSHPLQNIISKMLDKNIETRLNSSEVLEYAEKELAAFLRTSSHYPIQSKLSPIDQLKQIKDYFGDTSVSNLLPLGKKIAIKERLENLKSAQGFKKEDKQEIENLIESLS